MPWSGSVMATSCSASPSGSLSLAAGSTRTGVPGVVVAKSACALGGALPAVTATVTAAVAAAPCGSTTS